MSSEICVDGFPPSVTEEELKILFSECGAVLSVEVLRSAKGNSLGVAYLQMESAQAVEKAVQLFHHATLEGRTLLVSHNSQAKPAERAWLHART